MISNQPISILTEGRHVTKQRHENNNIQINQHPAKQAPYEQITGRECRL